MTEDVWPAPSVVSCFYEGEAAFAAHDNEESNPYPYGSEKYKAWFGGWFNGLMNDRSLCEWDPVNETEALIDAVEAREAME